MPQVEPAFEPRAEAVDKVAEEDENPRSMDRRPISLLIALIAWTILLVVLLVQRHEPPGSERSDTPPAHAGVDDPPRASLEVPETAASADRTASRPSSVAASGVRVLVVERGSGRPMAGAEVRCAGVSELMLNDPHRPRWTPEIDELLAAVHARSITDAHGEVWIEPSSVPAVVDARFEGRWGGARIYQTSDRPVIIELAIDRGVDILVVDGAGTPVADVPVAMGSCSCESSRCDIWSANTGTDGLAHLRHVDSRLAGFDDRRACIHLAILARDLESVPLDPDALPREPIRLVLPPTGAVEVETVSDGSTPVLVSRLQLEIASQVNLHFQSFSAGGRVEPDRIEAGRAEFSHVALGLEICANGFIPGYPGTWTNGRGPRIPGERVKLVHDLGHGYPAFVVRLVDEHLLPLAGLDLQVRLDVRAGSEGGGGGWDSNQSDAQGRVSVRMLIPETTEIVGSIGLRVVSPGTYLDWCANLPVPVELHDGENDLGVLRLIPPELVAAGTVVDDQGEPVPGAWIEVESRRLGSSDDVWVAASGLHAASDEHGRFTIHGSKPRAEMRVHADERGHARGESVEGTPGSLDMRIVLPRPAVLTGSVLLDPSFPRDELRVVVFRPSEPPQSGRGFYNNEYGFALNGTFKLSGLRPGIVDVQFKCALQREPLLVVEHVMLVPGEVTGDPRLQHVDLRAARLFQLDVADPSGAPIELGQVWWKSPSLATQSTPTNDGKAMVVALASSVDLEVRAPGYRTEHLRSVSGDMHVALQRGLALRVRIPAGVSLPEPPAQLGLCLRLVKDRDGVDSSLSTAAPSDSVDAFIDVGADALVLLPAAGTYELRWMLRRDPKTSTRSRELANAQVERTEVAESTVEQFISAAPDAAEYAAMLRSIADDR